MSFSNESLKILMLIGRHGPLSRSKISKEFDFTPSRVTRLTEVLLTKGLIHEVGHEKSTGGRRSALLALKEHSHVLCGIRISIDLVMDVVLMDMRANILDKEIRVLDGDLTPDEVVAQIRETIDRCFQRNEGLRQRTIGAGIGVSGLVNPEKGVWRVSRTYPKWQDVPLAELLSQSLDMPVYLENEITMSTHAELWFGQGRGCRNFIYINLGAGMRMGMVIDGALYRGVTGNAGELGHNTYNESGPICHCGNTGCLERYTSTEVLQQRAREALESHSASVLLAKCDGRVDQLKPEHIYQAVLEKDRLACTLLRRTSIPIGRAVANLVNIFDTEKIIFGGRLCQAGDLLLEYVRQQVDTHAFPVLAANTRLEFAAFEQYSTAIGGGALILEKICAGDITLS